MSKVEGVTVETLIVELGLNTKKFFAAARATEKMLIGLERRLARLESRTSALKKRKKR